MNTSFISCVSILLVPLAFTPIGLQFVARCGLISFGVVACGFAFWKQHMWIAFVELICVVYLTLETAFRNTLYHAPHEPRFGVIAGKRLDRKPRIIKSHAMHHGIWAGALVFECIAAFGYGRFTGPGWLGSALVMACVLIWVPPNFRAEFSEFDPKFVGIRHHATLVCLVAWRLVSVCVASNLSVEPFWCYVGFAVLLPILGAGIMHSSATYFDLSIQAEALVLGVFVLTDTDTFMQTPPTGLQWATVGGGGAYVAYTMIKLAREYPKRVLVQKTNVSPAGL